MPQEFEVVYKSGKKPIQQTTRLVAEDADRAARIMRDAGFEVVSVSPWTPKSTAKLWLRIALAVGFIGLIFASTFMRGCQQSG